MRLLSILFLFFSFQVSSQEAADSLDFPASWEGAWSGTLDIFNGSGKVQSIPMMLEIFPIDSSETSRYTFGIMYGSKSTDWRPYELVPVDPAKGLWQVDEKNSIVIESYLYGPKFISWFTVMGSRVLACYEKINSDTLVFEIISGKEEAVSSTGNEVVDEETIPEVNTFPISVFQRAILTRKPGN
jgi:hypothetical protein